MRNIQLKVIPKPGARVRLVEVVRVNEDGDITGMEIKGITVSPSVIESMQLVSVAIDGVWYEPAGPVPPAPPMPVIKRDGEVPKSEAEDYDWTGRPSSAKEVAIAFAIVAIACVVVYVI